MSIEVIDFLDRLPSDWRPRSEPQRLALMCPADLLCFGGAAGSLKSETILVDALKYNQHKDYRGIIFRKTYGELEFLIDRTRTLYSNTGGRLYEGAMPEWRWPWGAVLSFRHMDKKSDVHKRQGDAYQYVAFDESTHQKEFTIRYIFNSRMRSTSGIPLRMRLATNPGNVGHSTHKTIFQGPKCIHCIMKYAREHNLPPKWLPESRKPGVIYTDARWPSDGVPIEASTCFIPGLIKDHNLLGPDYEKKLRGMPAALREALKEGCWEAFEGQYFDCFDSQAHVIERDRVGEKDWWPYWISVDYGFGHAAVAYLWTMDPTTNHVYTLDEYIRHRRKAVDFALDIEERWGDRKIRAAFMGRDIFKHDGDQDFSRAEQMCEATSIPFTEAYQDRASGAMLMYTLLSENRWSICDSCALLPMAMQSRIHAENDPEDVEKDETDEDDAYDSARYGAASYIRPTERSEAEILQEKIDKEWSKDPTVRAIQHQMWMAEKGRGKDPSNYRARVSNREAPQQSTADILKKLFEANKGDLQ